MDDAKVTTDTGAGVTADTGAATTTPPPAAVPPVDNKVAELERKLQERESELQMIREQQLTRMGQGFQAPPQAAPQPAPDDSEIDALFQSGDPASIRKATELLMARKQKEIVQLTQKVSADTYQRENIKKQVIDKYPDLKNGNSEFFKRVAYFMETHPFKWQDPEGLLDACVRVADDMKLPSREAQTANEIIRKNVASGAAAIEGNTNPPPADVPALDAKGLEMARKLGIDPKKYSERLNNYVQGKAEYEIKEGKTGKASI